MGSASSTGAWLIHLFFLILGKVLLSIVPGMTTDTSWTILNLGYIFVRAPVDQRTRRAPLTAARSSRPGVIRRVSRRQGRAVRPRE